MVFRWLTHKRGLPLESERMTVNFSIKLFRNISSIILILLLIAGCGGEDPPARGNQITSSPDAGGGGLNTGPDADADADADGSEGEDELCADVDCDDGFECVEGVCQAQTAEGFGCAAPRELGELGAGSQIVEVEVPDGQPNIESTSCAPEDNSPEAVFSFRVAQPSRVRLQVLESAEQNIVVEAREGACRDSEAAIFCEGASSEGDFYAMPDETYYLLAEARTAYVLKDFTLEISVDELACSPPDEWSCDGGERTLCWRGEEERVFGCAQGCDGNECLGNSCQNPIEVAGATTLVGDLVAYSDNINFTHSPSCSTEGTAGPNTRGKEVVVLLKDLQTDQEVIVDAKGSAFSAAIGITSECGTGPMECIAADSIENYLEWKVVNGGDYYLIIDALRPQDAEFQYSIEIRE